MGRHEYYSGKNVYLYTCKTFLRRVHFDKKV